MILNHNLDPNNYSLISPNNQFLITSNEFLSFPFNTSNQLFNMPNGFSFQDDHQILKHTILFDVQDQNHTILKLNPLLSLFPQSDKSYDIQIFTSIDDFMENPQKSLHAKFQYLTRSNSETISIKCKEYNSKKTYQYQNIFRIGKLIFMNLSYCQSSNGIFERTLILTINNDVRIMHHLEDENLFNEWNEILDYSTIIEIEKCIQLSSSPKIIMLSQKNNSELMHINTLYI